MRNMGAATIGSRSRAPATIPGAVAPMFKFLVTC
jgi:hypothetical protein